jgi:hypothetical protein
MATVQGHYQWSSSYGPMNPVAMGYCCDIGRCNDGLTFKTWLISTRWPIVIGVVIADGQKYMIACYLKTGRRSEMK